MTTPEIIVLVVLESVGLLFIARLWLRKSRTPLWRRCLWSVVLLIPLLGVLYYGFTRPDPEAHADDVPETPT